MLGSLDNSPEAAIHILDDKSDSCGIGIDGVVELAGLYVDGPQVSG